MGSSASGSTEVESGSQESGTGWGKEGGSKQKYKKEDEESILVAIEDRMTVPASQEKLRQVARCGGDGDGGGPRLGSFVAKSLGNGEDG